MVQTLLISAVLMGLAGTPHCLAMCGAASTVACAQGGGGRAGRPGGSSGLPFHLGRLVSYSAAGAVVAASVGSLAALGQAVSALRPLWTMVHLAALALGLFLLWQGRQPGWMERLGRSRHPGSSAVAHRGGAWQRVNGPARQAGAGLAWVAWPCGLLQSALLVAGLADGPWQGALVMAGFAMASGLGLAVGPALWWRLSAGRRLAGGPPQPASTGGAAWLVSPALAVRLAGLALAGASAWALGHGLWLRVAAWCFG